jgi:hypothetical protein
MIDYLDDTSDSFQTESTQDCDRGPGAGLASTGQNPGGAGACLPGSTPCQNHQTRRLTSRSTSVAV